MSLIGIAVVGGVVCGVVVTIAFAAWEIGKLEAQIEAYERGRDVGFQEGYDEAKRRE